MNNLELFEYSKTHPEPLLDPHYAKKRVVIPENAAEENDLTKAHTKLIDLITTFSTMHFQYKKSLDDETVARIISDIIDIFDHTANINYCEFSQFFMVYNFTYFAYLNLPQREKVPFIYDMLIKYCQERHGMYCSHGYSHNVLQVMSDNYSHKRNSRTTIDKIIKMLSSYSFQPLTHFNKISSSDNFYFLPDKGGQAIFNEFLKKYNIAMESRKIEQGKLPDIVFCHQGNFYICELKTMKGEGGGQNKQIVEVAYFIKFSEKNSRIHYITFLDSHYANELFDPHSPKVKRQKDDILTALKNNPGNYFLNTESFSALLHEIMV